MPSLSSLARRFSDRTFGTSFERTLASAARRPKPEFLFFWNRGLGDIALGLVPLFLRIHQLAPGARIVIVTREELRSAFGISGADEVHVIPGLKREDRADMRHACARLGIKLQRFAAVFGYPDPNRWLEGHRREHPPRLPWNKDWDALAPALPAGAGIVVGAHVNSETARYYGYRKDWPAERWQELFSRFGPDSGVRWVLLGYEAKPGYQGANITDLRGATDFPALMSLLRNRLRVLVAPDSGILSMGYYIDASFALDVISLWADPRQGVLHQGVPSPNPLLRHYPLVAPGEDIRALPVETVEAALRNSLGPGYLSGSGKVT